MAEERNEEIIQEMLRNAKPEEIPGDLTRNPVIHKGDESEPAPMVVTQITSVGYVWVWETDTYEKVPILYYMLPSKLRQRRPDGSYRFTTINPGKKPARGSIKCMLHPEAENREHYTGLGFRTCPKNNITSRYQLEQHMAKRHPQEWAAIKAEIAAKEREEDRTLQRLILQSQLKAEKSKKE